MNFLKKAVLNIAITFGALFVFALCAEIVLRFLPVAEGLVAQPVNAENPVFRFRKNRTVTWSRGVKFELVNRLRVNNAGFVNDQDYRKESPRPLIAVVGDSYVEAAMVPFEETLHGRLARTSDKRVYSFAASGAPLSQYVVWSKYARESWDAEKLIVVIIGNDFDESLLRYKQGPGFHHYREAQNGELRLHRVDYRPSPVRRILRRSALARYLYLNVQIVPRWQALLAAVSGKALADTAQYFGNTAISLEPERVRLSKKAVDTFLRDLQQTAGWHPGDVLFVVDGFRYPDRAERGATSFFGVLRSYFMRRAGSVGYAVVDMDMVFFDDFAQNATRFEFPQDGHWNGHAHALAASAVRSAINGRDIK